jgi:hypothetical protein
MSYAWCQTKKYQKQQDAPNDTELAFFEVGVLSDFEKASYTCKTLQQDWCEPLTDRANWDACNPMQR